MYNYTPVIREELILRILLRANTGIVESPYNPYGKYGMFCVLGNTLGLEGIIERVDF